MKYPIELNIEMFDLPAQKVANMAFSKLWIYEDYVISEYRFTVKDIDLDDENKELVIKEHEERRVDACCFYPKNTLSCVETYYSDYNKGYKMVVIIPGTVENLYYWFKRRSKAFAMGNIFRAYILNNLTAEHIHEFESKPS